MNQINPLFLVIDLFCGFGGTTLGYMESLKALVIACVNHDPKAIKSHWLNHPEVEHFEEDIRTLELTRLIRLVEIYRAFYPNAKVVLWASLECTNFSNAKGGQSRDADSRTLAEYLDRYVIALNPDYIKIENVVEFRSWGPLRIKAAKLHKDRSDLKIIFNKKTKKEEYHWIPVNKLKGRDYEAWKNRIDSLGYRNEWRELNSANYGAYTSRNRLFGCFAKHGLPIVWPTPTHAKKPTLELFGSLQKWLPVKEVLDFSDEGRSIFGRKKEMSQKTLEVIYKGMLKAISEGNDSILFKYYGNGDNLNSIDSPAGTVTTKDRFAKLAFIFRQYKTGFTTSINEPIGALPTVPKASIISFIMNKSHGAHTTSVNAPSPVVVARQDKAPLYLIQAFMDENDIIDVKHRMLKIPELLQIQGFPVSYKMIGTQKDKKKFIGNSVHKNVPKAWAIEFASELQKLL